MAIGYDESGHPHYLCEWWDGEHCGQVGQTADTRSGEVRLDGCSCIRSGARCAVRGMLEEA